MTHLCDGGTRTDPSTKKKTSDKCTPWFLTHVIELNGGLVVCLAILCWISLGVAKFSARAVSSMINRIPSGKSSSEEEMPGEANTWNPLLCTAYHYYNGERMAQFMTYRSKAYISQTCHFAVFLNPIERESMDWYFHIMQDPNEGDNEVSTACSSENGENEGDGAAAE